MKNWGVFCAVLCCACGGNNESNKSSNTPNNANNANNDNNGTPNSMSGDVISAADGGTLVSEDGRFTLEIPPGALDEDTALTIEVSSEAPDGAIGDVYDLGPDGVSFSPPATATIELSLLEATGAVSGESGLPSFYIGTSEDGSAIEELEGSETLYPADGGAVITAPVDHFSYFWAGGQQQPYGVNLGVEVAASQTTGGGFEANVIAENRSGTTQYLRFRASGTGVVSAAGGGTAPTEGSTPLGSGGATVEGTLAFVCDEVGEGEIRVHLGYGSLENSPETSGVEVAKKVVCREGDGTNNTSGRPTTCMLPMTAAMELNEALQAYSADFGFEPGMVCDLDTPSGWRDTPGPSAAKLVFRAYTADSPFGEERHLFVPNGAKAFTVTAVSAGQSQGPGTWVGLPDAADFTVDFTTDAGADYQLTARFDGTNVSISSVDAM